MRIDRAELVRLAPLGAAHALVMAALYVLKPVRNAVFLDRLGVGKLPYATILVAVSGAAVGALYARLAGRVRLDRLVLGTFALAVAGLLALDGALDRETALSVYTFYVVVALTGVVTTSLVWLLGNEVFDARQARRLFGALGAAGIAGAIAGGLFTKGAVHALGSKGLLHVATGMLATSVVLVAVCIRMSNRARGASVGRRPARDLGPLGDVVGSELLRAVTVAAALGGIVSVIADIQYNDFVARTFATRESKAAFLGVFSAALSAFAFLVQLLVTPRVLSSRGVGAALLFLPIALGGGSLALLALPSLFAASVLKLADGGLRHSIHKAAGEILLVPVPSDVRARTKLFLDATVATTSEALGAALVLVLTRVAGLSYPVLGVASLLLVVAWVGVTVRARRAYVGAFRHALERRELDLSELRINVVDPGAIGTLTAALAGKNERAIVYSLDMLADVRDPTLVPTLVPLLSHASARVRKKAVRVLRQQDEVGESDAFSTELGTKIEALLHDVDADVRTEASLLVGRDGRFHAMLQSADLHERVAAIAFIAEAGTEDDKARIDEALLRSILEASHGKDGATLRAQLARALGGLPSRVEVLRELTLDPSDAVVASAIESAGRIRDERIVDWLVERLGRTRYRKLARKALASLQGVAVARLGEVLADEDTPRAIRLQLPRVLAKIPRQEVVDVLEGQLTSSDGALVLAVARALSELKRTAALSLSRARIEPVLAAAIREFDELGSVERGSGALDESSAGRLLMRAVRERRAMLLERTFRLLGLLYSPKEMSDAYHGVLSGNRALRAHAIEFLDNVVDRRLGGPLARALEERHERRPLGRSEILERLTDNGNSWLRACALACEAGMGPDRAS